MTHSADCEDRCAAGCPVADLDAQSGNVRTAGLYTRGHVNSDGPAAINIDRVGTTTGQYDDTGGASRFFPTFRYNAKAGTSERPFELDGEGRKIKHPTVKPLELMRWLVRLVAPQGALILDPFCGSGTTGEAALLENMRAILIDQDDDSIRWTKKRLSKPLQVGMF
jgi:site-specific DNA-methyltransferase (adenine-specific)